MRQKGREIVSRLRFTILILITLLVASAALVARTAAAKITIDPRVLEDTANGQTGRFLVVLSQQARLRAPAGDRAAQGRAVVDTLRAAAASQAPARAQLDALGAKQRAYWVVNMIAAEGNRAAVEAMAARPDVLEIESDRSFSVALETAEALSPDAVTAVGWNLNWINAPAVWAQ